MKTALVLGGAGFIGTALTARLRAEGFWVRAIDNRLSMFAPSSANESSANEFEPWDLRLPLPEYLALAAGQPFDEVYQLAADMGGAGFIFTGEHDADVMANNARINLNVAAAFKRFPCRRLLYTSSSCVYNDADADSYGGPLVEDDADQQAPTGCYGWEKLFSEKLYQAHARNHGLNVCITRFATIYGPGSVFEGGRENAVAAICRKVLEAPDGGTVEVWGDGKQVRPLVYIDDLLGAITGLMRCVHCDGPINIANSELAVCNDIASKAIALSGKRLTIKNVPGPTGKQVLNMDTTLAQGHLGWSAKTPFDVGLALTFDWIAAQKSRLATHHAT